MPTTPTDIPAPPPSANGDLIHRVQQLRLDDQLGRGPGATARGSWLPWVLCAMLAVAWVGVGVRYYRSQPARTDDTGTNGQAGKPEALAEALSEG